MKTQEHYSQKAIDRVASALDKGGHTVKLIEVYMHAIEEMQGFMSSVVLGERPGMVFNMAYGIQWHNRYTHVPAMLEMPGIPYIGSDPLGEGFRTPNEYIIRDSLIDRALLLALIISNFVTMDKK